MKIKINQIFTLLAIVCFVLLTRNLFILRFVQPVGYVVDIYSMFPLSFYLAFMFCYLVATFLVLNGKKVLGTLILCINHFEILIIPYMLGYYSMGRADDMSYIGEYLQIATSGHFADWDIYPASHIIGASISFVLITLFIPFTHPFIVFFLFAVFLFHMLPTILSTSNLEVLRIPKIKVSSLLLLVIPFMGWFIYNNTLLGSFKSNYISYIKKITEPVFVETTGKLTKINFVVSDYIQLISFFYGRYIIPTLLILASFIFIYLNKDIIKRKCLKNYPYLVVLSVVLFFVQIILLFTPIISHQPDRIMNLNFVVYAQVPLFACALYLLFLEKSQSNSRILLVCGILLLVWSLSLFGCFDSPNVYRTNVALTQNEVSGMNWFYKVKDKSIIGTPFSQIERFNYLFGNFQAVDIIYHFPDHFGYANNSSNLADINLQEVQKLNIIILTIDELLYQEVPGYKTVGRYTKEDFNRFKTDSSVIKIFDSTNIEIFRSYHEVNS